MALPQFQSSPGGQSIDSVFTQMQNVWAQILNKLISRPQNNSLIIPDVDLVVGSNTIQHGLGSTLTGWSIVRINGVASIYDTQATNSATNKSLVLVSDAIVTVTLEVF
jgi:hypothetical protein